MAPITEVDRFPIEKKMDDLSFASPAGQETKGVSFPIVDLARYPIDRKGSPALGEVIRSAKDKYRSDGIVTFPGFLVPSAIASAVEDINRGIGEGDAWVTDKKHNVFLDSGDDTFGEEHARNKKLNTRVAALAYDRLSADNVLRLLYENDDFMNFLCAILEMDVDGKTLYRSADPLGAW